MLREKLRAAVHRRSLSDWIAVETSGFNRMLLFRDAEAAAAAYARAGRVRVGRLRRATVIDDAGRSFVCIDTRYPAEPVDRDRPPWWLVLAARLVR